MQNFTPLEQILSENMVFNVYFQEFLFKCTTNALVEITSLWKFVWNGYNISIPVQSNWYIVMWVAWNLTLKIQLNSILNYENIYRLKEMVMSVKSYTVNYN